MSPDMERIMELHPEALFISPFESSSGYGKLDKMGTPIIECADYMETTALGRAEWMKFYGILFGRECEADSLFHVVDSCYQAYRAKAAHLPLGRSVITERKTGSVWYCPGGQSTIAQIIRDAHGQYAFSRDGHSGSLPLSFEQVLDKAGQADVWAFKYSGGRPLSRRDLLDEFGGYAQLKAFKRGDIYECDSDSTRYFEEIPFRPDVLLREFVILLHPENAALGTLRYYHRLQ